MKVQEIVPVIVMVGAAIFLVFRSSDGAGADTRGGVGSGQSGAIAPGAGAVGSDGEGRGDRKLSTRVFRDRAKVVTTESGLQYEVLQEGEGESPGPNDVVEVHYEGILEDGMVFDSSYLRGSPSKFGVNQVIKGWTEGLQLMKPGATYRFVIPPNLGYGDRGAGDKIPGNATLDFEVTLLSVTRSRPKGK